ncbi:NAD(P)H-dependent oxidoreductase [uncultured Bifidobacterium sp.]|uniref:NAD(P)H-dependent oxidoreductase n=1 Tax=uncultured Bifidobacterium sp. TaxID=165187 RepID=UPI0026128969|nr:NAD(P)H-dependent oxidoreductase [uncultured Bifidobacterium sp.]
MNGTTALRVVVLGASPSATSTSQRLAELAVDELSSRYDATVERVDVYHLGPGLTGAISREDVDETAERALTAVEESDVLVVSIPTYRGSYPGMFKHFMDIVRQRPFNRKPVLLMATGGSPRHMLMIDHVLRPLFAFLHSYTAPTAVFATSADFDGDTVTDPEIPQRVTRAVEDLAPFLEHRSH